jgi:large subunit ribosomal protein L17
MRKRYNFRQLGRTTSHKWAMLRNMVTSLIEHERIVTTTAKAKEVRSLAEKVVTMAKNDNAIHARRQINRIVQTDAAATKLLNVLGPRYVLRSGGYTRIMKIARPRVGVKAAMANMSIDQVQSAPLDHHPHRRRALHHIRPKRQFWSRRSLD